MMKFTRSVSSSCLRSSELGTHEVVHSLFQSSRLNRTSQTHSWRLTKDSETAFYQRWVLLVFPAKQRRTLQPVSIIAPKTDLELISPLGPKQKLAPPVLHTLTRQPYYRVPKHLSRRTKTLYLVSSALTALAKRENGENLMGNAWRKTLESEYQCLHSDTERVH